MKGYKITNEQKQMLEGVQMQSAVFYNPVQNINGDWFIFQKEFEACGFGEENDFVAPEEEII